MAQLTADATAGKSMLNMIAGGMGYIIMGSINMISMLKQMAKENTIKSAVQAMTTGGNVGSAARLSQILADANAQNSDITAIRLSVEDYNKFTREASFRGLLYAGTLDMEGGCVLFPVYQKENFKSLIEDLGITTIEESTSVRDFEKAAVMMDAVDIAEKEEYSKFAKRGDKSEPVPITEYDFGRAPKGKVYVYDLDENGMPTPGSANPMTGKSFEKGDVFFRDGKVDPKTGKMVGGVRFYYTGDKFIKGTCLPTDHPGVLKDTIKFFNPEQYEYLKNLKGDNYRKAIRDLFSAKQPNNFNRKVKVGQTVGEMRDILTYDASVFRSMPQDSLSPEDVLTACINDIRNVAYVDWNRFSAMKPFSGKSSAIDFDKKTGGVSVGLEKYIRKELEQNPDFYKVLPADIASHPSLIEIAVKGNHTNWQYVPQSFLKSIQGVNQNPATVNDIKNTVIQYLTLDPSKPEYTDLDANGLARPTLSFIKDIPDEVLGLFSKDELSKIAEMHGAKIDYMMKTQADKMIIAPAETSYAEEAKAAIDELYSTRVQTQTKFEQQRFAKPANVKHPKRNPSNALPEKEAEKVAKKAAKEAARQSKGIRM